MPRMSSSKDFCHELVVLVKQFPWLYDLTRPDYKDNTKKNETWDHIADTLGRNAQDCQLRWKCLRDKFGRERKEFLKTKSMPKKWIYYDQMLFLADHMRHKRLYRKECDEDDPSQTNSWASYYMEDSITVECEDDVMEKYPKEEMDEKLPVSENEIDIIDINQTMAYDQNQPTSLFSSTDTKPILTNGKRSRPFFESIQDVRSLRTPQGSSENISVKKLVDSEDFFCASIAETLRELPKRKCEYAKMRIQSILFEVSDDSYTIGKS